MGYLHLSPSATGGDELLEQPTRTRAREDIVETEDPAIEKVNG